MVQETVNSASGVDFVPVGGDVSTALASGTNALTARFSLDDKRRLRVTATPEEFDFTSDACSSTAGWTVLGDATESLVIGTNYVNGTGALDFDKADGTNIKVAGVQKTITSVDLETGHSPSHEVAMWVYVSALTDVDYAFIRLGTNSTTYSEYRMSHHELIAGEFAYVHRQLGGFTPSAAGAAGQASLTAVTYIAVGVAFLVESDTLENIAIDGLALIHNMGDSDHENASLVVDGTVYETEEAAVQSPDTDVGTTPVAMAIPAQAKFLHLRANAALRFGSNATLDGTAGEGYDYLPAYDPSGPIPVLDGTAMYVRINAASGTCTVWHRWEVRTG